MPVLTEMGAPHPPVNLTGQADASVNLLIEE
jgi:hypothetical protein